MGNIIPKTNEDPRKKYECEITVDDDFPFVLMASDLQQLRRLLMKYASFKDNESLPWILDSQKRLVYDNETFMSLENRKFFAISSKAPADGIALLDHERIEQNYQQFETPTTENSDENSLKKLASKTLLSCLPQDLGSFFAVVYTLNDLLKTIIPDYSRIVTFCISLFYYLYHSANVVKQIFRKSRFYGLLSLLFCVTFISIFTLISLLINAKIDSYNFMLKPCNATVNTNNTMNNG